MAEQKWITMCAQRLISMYGYGRTDAEHMAEVLAAEQADRYGDGPWLPPFAAADECGRDGE